jgi:indolepyruvate ferredoxin oxidoreductase
MIATAALRRPDYQLSDNLWADAGSIFITGTQALMPHPRCRALRR